MAGLQRRPIEVVVPSGQGFARTEEEILLPPEPYNWWDMTGNDTCCVMVPVLRPSSRTSGYLLECFDVADWRQIQVRIRKAKTGVDAPDKLTRLYDKTHDGMVAYELAQVLENAGQTETAVHWYGTAIQRFRRADWRKKAEDALTRLGAPVPTVSAEPATPAEPPQPEAAAEIHAEASIAEPEAAEPQGAPAESGAATGGERHKRRRRGRRGGRRRRKGGREQKAPAEIGRAHV